jgi:hypothetical protein
MYYPPQVPVQPQFQNNFQPQIQQPQFNEQLYKQQNGYVAPTYTPFNQQIDSKPTETMTDVYGIEGAKAYLVGAGNIATLFDNENKDIFYRKGADKSGKVNLFEIYRYQKIDEHELKNNSEVTVVKENQNELDRIRNEIEELRQTIKQMRQQQMVKKNPNKKEVAE